MVENNSRRLVAGSLKTVILAEDVAERALAAQAREKAEAEASRAEQARARSRATAQRRDWGAGDSSR